MDHPLQVAGRVAVVAVAVEAVLRGGQAVMGGWREVATALVARAAAQEGITVYQAQRV